MTIGRHGIGLSGAALLLVLSAGSGRAEDTVTAKSQDGYSRLSFAFAPSGHVRAASDGSVLTLSFDRKTTLDPAAMAALMGPAVAGVRADADGKTFRFALNQPLKLHQSALGDKAVVDLAPLTFAGSMPDLTPPPRPSAKPVEAANLPELKLRAGTYANFTRLVFDWPRSVAYTVFPGAGKMTVKFAAPVRMDLSAITRFQPPWVKNAAWHLDGNTTLVVFETDADSGYHDFRDGTKIVLDILAPKTDAAAYTPPGTVRPPVTAMRSAAITTAQAAAIADAAAHVAPPAAAQPPKPALQKDAPQKDAAPQTAAATVPGVAAARVESQVTAAGAVLNFKNANTVPSAVFVRGLTAWIVLENSPAFDADAVKAALNGFADGLEVSSSPGVSILRITLKTAAPIAAAGNGADLKVVIGKPANTPPVDVGFDREQDDPGRPALTAFLPHADRSFALSDPATGDTLTVIPGSSGYAVRTRHEYAEFAALPTASGMVLMPFADDLQVTVAQTQIRIGRPGGLSLTPPALPADDTPAAMARAHNDPAFLDFARWGRLTGGSFLATERQMGQAVARLTGPDADHARLILARFYLANRFAPEALGLIALIQAHDPALAGDVQLATMRGAADDMMGRTRDAHNVLSGMAFESNPHAALWRGLAEAQDENWRAAHNDLALAAPVLGRYPADWQARARLAAAEAALGIGRLELADAAMHRLPRELSPAEALEAELVRARITAMTGSYHDAVPHFAAVENGGNERLAAQAIYDQTDAGLTARAIAPQQGIAMLERLRFRWRGDALEMKTLRRLAGLYFAAHRWREGLKTLRVATQNFQGDDAARAAEDDMRAAFVNLFLKGGADTMPPVEQLALFYDNVDLTPIGADGDEMIRHMADRLVAVDLLGPAASLLAYQVDNRLDGVAKAQVATRLAAVYLMDHKPQAAIDVLHKTQITGLPDDAIHARLLLEARGFAGLKQWDNALDLIAVDNGEDTQRLRADIYWESGNWDVAGQKTEALLGDRFGDTAPLTGAERGQVLRMAVAYSLANDEASLDRLRDHFAAKMAATPDANAFAVLSQSIAMHGLAFRDAARQIASVDTLEAFMKDFGARHETVATN